VLWVLLVAFAVMVIGFLFVWSLCIIAGRADADAEIDWLVTDRIRDKTPAKPGTVHYL
jgi:hypothetical protein